jgi:hypothetical protein
MMSTEDVHALKLRIWKQAAKKRPEYLSDLDTALLQTDVEARDAALAVLAKRLARAEALNERNRKRKEAAVKAADAKLRQDLGF